MFGVLFSFLRLYPRYWCTAMYVNIRYVRYSSLIPKVSYFTGHGASCFFCFVVCSAYLGAQWTHTWHSVSRIGGGLVACSRERLQQPAQTWPRQRPCLETELNYHMARTRIGNELNHHVYPSDRGKMRGSTGRAAQGRCRMASAG